MFFDFFVKIYADHLFLFPYFSNMYHRISKLSLPVPWKSFEIKSHQVELIISNHLEMAERYLQWWRLMPPPGPVRVNGKKPDRLHQLKVWLLDKNIVENKDVLKLYYLKSIFIATIGMMFIIIWTFFKYLSALQSFQVLLKRGSCLKSVFFWHQKFF